MLELGSKAHTWDSAQMLSKKKKKKIYRKAKATASAKVLRQAHASCIQISR